MAKKEVLPPPVQELIDYLRSTGTGESKLDKIAAIGKQCKSGEDGKVFLLSVKEAVTDVTWKKIEEFQSSKVQSVSTPEDSNEDVVDDGTDTLEESEQESGLPTEGMKVEESITAIRDNKFTEEQLQLIVAFDKRKTVVHEAKQKLGIE